MLPWWSGWECVGFEPAWEHVHVNVWIRVAEDCIVHPGAKAEASQRSAELLPIVKELSRKIRGNLI